MWADLASLSLSSTHVSTYVDTYYNTCVWDMADTLFSSFSSWWEEKKEGIHCDHRDLCHYFYFCCEHRDPWPMSPILVVKDVVEISVLRSLAPHFKEKIAIFLRITLDALFSRRVSCFRPDSARALSGQVRRREMNICYSRFKRSRKEERKSPPVAFTTISYRFLPPPPSEFQTRP